MKPEQLTGILALVTVAEKRSFSEAAIELRVTPSAISQSVKQLEERLGIPLLTRTTRSVSLTSAGRAFVERCGPALTEIGLATQEARKLSGVPAGRLRINLPRPSFAATLETRLA